MLPDQIAREGSYLWEDGVMLNTCAIARADVGNCDDTLGQTTMVNQDEITVRKLPAAKECVREELIIHSLEV